MHGGDGELLELCGGPLHVLLKVGESRRLLFLVLPLEELGGKPHESEEHGYERPVPEPVAGRLARVLKELRVEDLVVVWV